MEKVLSLLVRTSVWISITALISVSFIAGTSGAADTGGFGSRTVGGSGRHLTPPSTRIYVVSSLADSGPGTLREAIEAPGPRTVVFSVAGTIKLRRPLELENSYITIAGETAPPPGIAVTRDRFAIMTHDVVVRHMRFFVGDSPGKTKGSDRQAIAIMSKPKSIAERILIDHCYLGGAIDENLSTHGKVRDFTVSNSIIANSLDSPISSARHKKGHHGKGVLIGDGTRRFSIIRCLLANNQDRNPRVKTGSQGEMINSVVYGWGGTTGWNVLNISDTDSKSKPPVLMSVIGNTYIPGPDGRCDIPIVYSEDFIRGSLLYMRDNVGPSCQTSERRKDRNDELDKVLTETPPISLSEGLQLMSQKDAYDAVLRTAGPRPSDNYRDDITLIREVVMRTGRIKAGIWGFRRKSVRYPSIRSSHKSLSIPKHPARIMSSGKTALEEWIAKYSAKVEGSRTL